MDSVDFFTIITGVFKDADEAFNHAVKNELLKDDINEGGRPVIGKGTCVELAVPEGIDPLVFAKNRAAQFGNVFWTFCDGPAACVEIKGKWLKKHQSGEEEKPKRFKMFVFLDVGIERLSKYFYLITRKKTKFP